MIENKRIPKFRLRNFTFDAVSDSFGLDYGVENPASSLWCHLKGLLRCERSGLEFWGRQCHWLMQGTRTGQLSKMDSERWLTPCQAPGTAVLCPYIEIG